MTALDDPAPTAPTSVARARHRPARTRHLAPSAIRALAAHAPRDVVDLGLGEPRWPLHPAAVRALSGHVPGDPCGYGPAEGLPALRRAVAGRHGVAEREVMIGAGAQGVLFSLVHASVGLGDLVAVPDPGFPGYRTLARLAGATPVGYPLAADGSLDPAAVADLLRRLRPALLVLNHPGNPTGGTADVDSMRTVLDAAAGHDALVVCDEVYRELGSRPARSVLDVRAPSARRRGPGVVAVSSVSKAWAAPGLRVGWAIGPEHVLAPTRLLHQAMTTSASRPAQLAATALLEESDDVLAASRAALRERWDVVDAARLPVRPASTGGLYLWSARPDGVGPADDEAHARWLRDQHGVLVVPGSVFGPAGAGHVRVGLGGGVEQLRLGLDRLRTAWATP